MTTLYELLNKLGRWRNVDTGVLQKARCSSINTKNCRRFKNLWINWTRGAYDEEPDLLIQHLTALIDG
jgi:hypothetical protein